MSGHKSTISLLLVLGMLFSATQLILAQTRAIQPVRIEATTAQEESISYIYEESHALIIGVSDYTNGWSKLAGVKEDVTEVHRALEENGFEVQLLEDPNKQQLEATIEDFIFEKGANPENRLLIYYAGHGHTKTLGYGGEMGYLVPADAPLPKKGRDIAFQRSVMSMQEIEVFAKNTSAKHVLFMFDACFAGSVFLATRAAPSYIEVFTQEPVRQFITSGSADQEVPDNSVFRRAFVDALAGSADFDKDGYLTGSELGTYIQKRTAEDWKGELTPQYGKLQDPNLNKGDFVFKIGKSENQSSTASTATANSDLAAQAWEVVKDSTNPKILEEYIRMFPTAPQRNLAKLKMMTLESPSPVQSPEDRVTAQVLSGEMAKKKLFRDNECVGCDLKDINMKGLYLGKADLRGANLMKADLRAVDLTEANLTNAIILGANTVGAKFCKTTMPDGSINNRDCAQAQSNMNQSSSVLSGEAAKKKLLETKDCVGCDLREADLMEMDLTGVNLEEANLEGAKVSYANLREAKLCRTRMPNGLIYYRDCAQAQSNMNQSSSVLSGEAAKKKLLETKDCVGCNLGGLNFRWTDLMKIDVSRAILSEADLTVANLRQANLKKAKLTRTIFVGASLQEANLTESDLTEANLSNANIRDAVLEGAKFCKTTMPDGSINNNGC